MPGTQACQRGNMRMLLLDKRVMPNCCVKVSPHGDLHDEQKGSAAGRTAEDAALGQGDDRAGTTRPAPKHPASATGESALPGRRDPRPATPTSRTARAG